MSTGHPAKQVPPGLYVASGLICLGIAVRIAITYPTHKNFSDADALLTGLTAFRILEGDAVVFFSGVRLGALESYFHAVAFAIAGASRETVALAPLLAGAAALVFFFLAMRELFGPRSAIAALLFVAIPSPACLYWTLSRDSLELDRWIQKVSLPGERVRLGRGLDLFLPSTDPAGRETGPEVAEFVQKAIEPELAVPLAR